MWGVGGIPDRTESFVNVFPTQANLEALSTTVSDVALSFDTHSGLQRRKVDS